MNDDAQTRCADFRVRLFLSVDLSGSTAFKNSKVGKGSDGVHPKWVNEFNRFYDRFPKEFQSKYRSAYSLDLGGDEPPRLWKAIGDELIFCGVITSIKSAECAIKAFTGTMFEFRKIYGQEVMPLDLKGAAWIAYFPEPNRTVLVHNGDGNQASEDDPIASEALEKKADHHPHRYDFLGSSIDEGFRVGSLASPSMFTLSAQLALLLCDPNGSLPLYYDGGALLKGVVTGIDYPRIYILTTSNMPTEELLIAQRELVGSLGSEKEKLKRYLSEFCKVNGWECAALPITWDGEGQPYRPPEFYSEIQQKITEHLKSQNTLIDLEPDCSEQEGPTQELDELTETLSPITNQD